MKLFLTLIATLWLAAGISQAQDSMPDYRPSVSNAFTSFRLALTNSIVLVQHKDQSAPHRQISIPRLVHNLQAINVSACPADFQIAWLDMIQAIKHFKPSAIHNEVGAVIWGTIAEKTGSQTAAKEAAKQQDKAESKDALDQAVYELKRMKIKYLAPPSAP